MADTSLVFDILTRGGKEASAEFLALAAAEGEVADKSDKLNRAELESAVGQKEAARAARDNAVASVEEAAAQDKAARSAKKVTQSTSLLRLALMAVAPAAVPAMAAAVVGIGALGTAVVGAGLGLAGFAAIAKSQFTAVQKATQKVTAAQQQYNLATTNKARQAALAKEKAAIEALTPAQRALYQQTNALKQAWAGVQKQLAVPVDNALVAWMHAAEVGMKLLSPIVRPVAAALKDLGNSAASALGSPYWRSFFTLMGGVGGHAVAAFGTILGNLAKGFAGLLRDFAPVSSRMLPALTRLSAKFAEWGNSARGADSVNKLIAYVARMGPQLVAVARAAGPALSKMAQALAGMGGASLGGITVILKAIGGMSPGQLQALAVGFLAIKASLTGIAAIQGITGLVGTFRDLAIAQKLASVATTLWTGAMWLLDAAMDANPVGIIILAIAGLVAAIIVVVKYHKQLVQAAVAAWHGIEYVAKKVWHGITSFFSGAWNMISGPISKAWNAVASVTTTVFNGILGFFRKWWPLLLVIFLFPVALMMAAWNHLHKGMEAAVKVVWNAISAFLGMIWNGIKTAASAVWSGIKTAIINPIKALVNWLSPAWTGIANAASRGWKMVYNAMVKPVIAGVSYIASLVKKVATYVWNGIVSAYNKVKGVGSWFLNIGKSIVNGIISGIRSAAGWLYNELKNLASNALNAAKSFLGINSPSKLFAQVVGTAIPEGIAKGVLDNTHLATGAVKTMSEALVPAGAPLGASTTGAASAGRGGTAVVRIDVTGADSEMKRVVRKWVRVDGGGNVQVALGG